MLETKTLEGGLIDADNFAKYTQSEQQQLQEKGLIVLYKGSDTILEYLFYKHKTKYWEDEYPANYIPFKIDLAATQAANPDWKISIDKDDEEQ